MHQPRDVAAEAGDLPHEARADVRSVERRNHEGGLQPRRQMPVHERHLILVLEIAHRTEPANEERGVDRAREVNQQSVESAHLNALLVGNDGLDEPDALVDAEGRRLRGVPGNGDVQPVDEAEAPHHEVLVPPCDRVEGPGVNGDPHK
jgi:hypothetical protein